MTKLDANRFLQRNHEQSALNLIERNPTKFETLTLFRTLSRKEDYTFTDPDTSLRFFETLKAEFEKAKNNSQLLYGLRTEMMFGYIAAALGWCSLVKQEDAGTIYFSESDLTLPDYRVVLNNGEEFFIEVENKFQKYPVQACYFKKGYINKIRRYAELFGKGLKIAVYWSLWNIWTLTSIADLAYNGKNYCLSFADAINYNEMSIIGDSYIGTVPPLAMKIIADPTKPQVIGSDGSIKFITRTWEFYCGGTKIEDVNESGLAWILMSFGNWRDSDPIVVENGNQVISIEYKYEPEETTPNQGFEIVGTLSGMLSRYFKSSTAPDGPIEHLEAEDPPPFLGFDSLSDYRGRNLRLWRFYFTASHKDVSTVMESGSSS
jgi:hypothetical protein